MHVLLSCKHFKRFFKRTLYNFHYLEARICLNCKWQQYQQIWCKLNVVFKSPLKFHWIYILFPNILFGVNCLSFTFQGNWLMMRYTVYSRKCILFLLKIFEEKKRSKQTQCMFVMFEFNGVFKFGFLSYKNNSSIRRAILLRKK